MFLLGKQIEAAQDWVRKIINEPESNIAHTLIGRYCTTQAIHKRQIDIELQILHVRRSIKTDNLKNPKLI